MNYSGGEYEQAPPPPGVVLGQCHANELYVKAKSFIQKRNRELCKLSIDSGFSVQDYIPRYMIDKSFNT
jgi:hypothetical protein